MVDIKNMKVLVVDDYATMVRIISNLLKQLGFPADNILTAKDGGDAYSVLKREKVDLVLSDWNMEPISGMQLLKKVRSDPEVKGVPFILITAESKTENIIAAKKAGVNNYIVKPFDAATLKKKLIAVIGQF